MAGGIGSPRSFRLPRYAAPRQTVRSRLPLPLREADEAVLRYVFPGLGDPSGRGWRERLDTVDYIGLVFYNHLLRYFVLMDLELGKLTHQDLGHMQMYVNYLDRHQREEAERDLRLSAKGLSDGEG